MLVCMLFEHFFVLVVDEFIRPGLFSIIGLVYYVFNVFLSLCLVHVVEK